jgi:hypothetical protein
MACYLVGCFLVGLCNVLERFGEFDYGSMHGIFSGIVYL